MTQTERREVGREDVRWREMERKREKRGRGRKREKGRERKKERRPSIVRDEDGSLLAKYDGWCEEHVNRRNDVSVWRVVQR